MSLLEDLGFEIRESVPDPGFRCPRCSGYGDDPEAHAEDPRTGAPEPVACRECDGSGQVQHCTTCRKLATEGAAEGCPECLVQSVHGT